MSTIAGIFSTQFLGEPAYRWALFVIIMGLFLAAWSGVLRHM